MGRFPGETAIENSTMVTSGARARMFRERDPSQLPWRELEIDAVVESTGVFRARDQLAMHLDAGASRVLLTVPAKDAIDYTVVMGVNEEGLAADHRIVSNASCTTNCLAPLAKVLHDSFGIREGVINTVHAYTNDQAILDTVHSDLRRARAAAMNIIPTTTGAAKAVGLVLPHLNGKLNGMAYRVPTSTVSVVDLVIDAERATSAEEINAAFERAATDLESPLHGVLEYETAPLVSSDFKGSPASSIIDALSTMVLEGTQVKVVSWYDNEWGYSVRVGDLCVRMAEAGLS